MNLKIDFYNDKKNCDIPFSHIEENITNPELKKIDEFYGAADVLSVKYAQKHEHNLWIISGFITTLAITLLLYDEAEFHWLIYACLILIVLTYDSYKIFKNSKYHEKSVEYRVFAEAIRVHYFLTISCTKIHVNDILPWFIKKGIPWIETELLKLPKPHLIEKKPISDCWIKDQKNYHVSALKKTTLRKEKNERITKIVLIITIFAYLVTLGFEIYMFVCFPTGIPEVKANMIRSGLKIVLGTMSAIALFTGSYYGKMSLPNKIDNHRRMIMLYEVAEDKIRQNNGREDEEVIIYLAREFLIENSIWYAYQNKNKLDFELG